ncbi:MAG: DUF1801 domain-containing protein [Ferruginibacter sp.]|nr:DUF1801 domain-containing protein [Chitinophagaceae bacterium]
MLNPADNYFLQQAEPVKSALHFLRAYILKMDKNISEKWQYGMPFFYYRDKRICYLWVHKKLGRPYLGIVEGNRISHPGLLKETRAKMKILPVDPARDIPVNKIRTILKQAISFYK